MLFTRILEAGLYGKELTVLWHGGEPLSVPTDYYREAYEIAKTIIPSSCSFRFNFQTNATLIRDDFCKFVKETNSFVGISLDGPQSINDAWRVDRQGRGVYNSIMRGVSMLKAHSIPFSVIGVLTRQSIKDPDALYEFFVELGAEEVGFNIDEIEGANKASSWTSDADAIADLSAYFRTVFRRVQIEKPATRFREIEQIVASIKFGTSTYSRLNNPFSIITMTQTGDFSTYAPELAYDNRFVLGNVHQIGFEATALSEKFLDIYGDIEKGKQACRDSCEYFHICSGGCPSNKLSENGTTASSETLHCILTQKTMINLIVDELDLAYSSTIEATH